MQIEEIGTYRDESTGNLYKVLRRTNEKKYQPLSGPALRKQGLIDYITSCGIDLQPIEDGEVAFEMIQIDGIIRRSDT